MPYVEKVIARMRREAMEAQAEAERNAEAPAAKKNKSRAAGPHDGVDVAPIADLLERAASVTLDPATLVANRVRGIESSESGEAAYKMLRTRVLHRMRSNGWQKLAVTSPRAKAGKTLTSINLAISLAHEPNQEVILVDLDMRNPRIADYLGLTPEFGLADYLKRDVPIEKVLLKPTNTRRLYIVPNTERSEHSSELLASRKMSAFTKTLASTSSSTIVIFDMPPLLEADDMLTFVPQSDAVLFVIAQCQTLRGDLEKSNELFKDLNLLGTVLNKSGDDPQSDYY